MKTRLMAAAALIGMSGAVQAADQPEWAFQIAAQGNAAIADVHRQIRHSIDQRAGEALAGELSWIRVDAGNLEAVKVAARGGSSSGDVRGVNCAPM